MARPWRDPNEPRREKREIFKKPKAEKSFPGKSGATPTPKDPYQDGMLRMFLDDERPCPPGFTLYRDLPAFEAGLAAADLSKLYAISLDWYLGCGIAGNGHMAAEMVATLIRDRQAELTELRIITCHSSDIPEAAKMARTIAAPIRESRDDGKEFPYIIVDVGKAIGKI